ncbi:MULTISPECIES: transposase [Burkholderia cepacia complex]|uniref:transposase n=1 Tax=Burkholderia cepacia complex TaxID=87882 RepID=UPI001C9486BF|nr:MULTISPECIES: transposase [Burkholderia cepacia complex]MBY4694808.1 transposase [Burkholderia latens]MDS0848480.1 transposase [Burkholderia cenocepacia]
MRDDEIAIASAADAELKRDCTRLRDDAPIGALSGLKAVLSLPLSVLQGSARSLRDLDFSITLPGPSYTVLCCWSQKNEVQQKLSQSTEPIDPAVDSTGMKVRSEGVQRVRTHGREWGASGYLIVRLPRQSRIGIKHLLAPECGFGASTCRRMNCRLGSINRTTEIAGSQSVCVANREQKYHIVRVLDLLEKYIVSFFYR